jgi:hypothetical protein
MVTRMQIHELIGHAGAQGWRGKVADVVAPTAAKRGPVSEDQARAIIGAAFFAVAVFYVVATIVRAVKSAR